MAFLGKNTYIAFQYHLQWTTYIFKGCEQFAKFFLHWLTYKRKKNMTSLFPYFMFQTFTVLHHFRHDLQLFCDTSSLLHLKTAKHNWQYCFDQIHEYTVYIIYISHISIYTSDIWCATVPTIHRPQLLFQKNRGASGAPGQNPKMLATNPRIMKISRGAKIKLLRGHGRNYG